MEITFGAELPVPIDTAFAFVSTPENWPKFFKDMKSAQALDGWGTPGGQARLVSRLLGREVVWELELVEWEAPNRFHYVMRHAGSPDLDNLRVFEATLAGCRLTGTSRGEPRSGIAGLYDRLVARAFKRAGDRAMRTLPDVVVREVGSRGR